MQLNTQAFHGGYASSQLRCVILLALHLLCKRHPLSKKLSTTQRYLRYGATSSGGKRPAAVGGQLTPNSSKIAEKNANVGAMLMLVQPFRIPVKFRTLYRVDCSRSLPAPRLLCRYLHSLNDLNYLKPEWPKWSGDLNVSKFNKSIVQRSGGSIIQCRADVFSWIVDFPGRPEIQ